MESTDETALEDFCKNFKSANAQEHQENKNDKLRDSAYALYWRQAE